MQSTRTCGEFGAEELHEDVFDEESPACWPYVEPKCDPMPPGRPWRGNPCRNNDGECPGSGLFDTCSLPAPAPEEQMFKGQQYRTLEFCSMCYSHCFNSCRRKLRRTLQKRSFLRQIISLTLVISLCEYVDQFIRKATARWNLEPGWQRRQCQH